MEPRGTIPPGAAETLAQALREAPERAALPPAQLARELGLPEPLVRQVQDYLRSPSGSDRPPTDEVRPEVVRLAEAAAWVAATVRSGWAQFAELFVDLTQRPASFLAGTSFAAVVAASAFGSAMPLVTGGRRGSGVQLDLQTPLLALTLVTLALHLACYYRHGMVRFALQGMAIVFGVGMPGVLMALAMAGAAQNNDAGTVILISVLVAAVLTSMYGALAAAVSVVGAVVRLRLEEARQARLTRQELLDRLLRIRERLGRLDSGPVDEPEQRFQRWATRYARSPWAAAFGLGLAMGGIRALLAALLVGWQMRGNLALGSLVGLMQVLSYGLYGLLSIGAGFYAGAIRRGIGAALVFALGAWTVETAATAGTDGEAWRRALESSEAAGRWAAAVAIGCLAGLGARVEERATRNRKMHEDDPAALIAEAVRIQWRLSPRARTVAVMAVDAVRSSQMKADADPLVAEWSFRAYHHFLESVAARWDGVVHSTAGDGSVIAFDSVADAFAAARAVQTEVAEFNRRTNRLKSPFRLRIGLHEGELEGDLDEVEFTDVIDVAAHVQEAAPVGGIAATERVVGALPDEPWLPLRDGVDGWPVSVALDPTAD